MTQQMFTPVAWSQSSNIYEVNLRQYTTEGTFNAFGKHLPRLRDMGVDILWFMPITPIAMEKRLGTLGSYYACSDYVTTNPEFGNVQDFTNLVEEAHKLGFKVIIDWVANHTGADHVWTVSNPDFYVTNNDGEFYDIHGWNDVIDLNYANEKLHTTMIECMQFWIDTCKIDGFRCDMAHLVPLEFWRKARTYLDQIKPLFWLAETEAHNYAEVFDATYRWEFLHKMEGYWKGLDNIQDLDISLQHANDSFPKGSYHLWFTTNHDENSHSGSEYERLGESALPFAVLAATWNGLPLIYSGQELPYKNRLKFFDKDEIGFNGTYELHGFFKTLLNLRKTHPALAAGCSEVTTYRLPTDAPKVFAFVRQAAGKKVLVVLNLSHEESWFQLLDEKGFGHYTEAFTGGLYHFTEKRWFQMKPWQYWVLEN
jgi:alpha-amylase